MSASLEIDTCPRTGCARFSAVPEPDAASVVDWAEKVLLHQYLGPDQSHIMVAPAAIERLVAAARKGLEA